MIHCLSFENHQRQRPIFFFNVLNFFLKTLGRQWLLERMKKINKESKQTVPHQYASICNKTLHGIEMKIIYPLKCIIE